MFFKKKPFHVVFTYQLKGTTAIDSPENWSTSYPEQTRIWAYAESEVEKLFYEQNKDKENYKNYKIVSIGRSKKDVF